MSVRLRATSHERHDRGGVAHVVLRYPKGAITLDGVAGINAVAIHRYRKEDMPAWRTIVARPRRGPEPPVDPPPHYFVIGRVASGGVHPVMLALAPLGNGEFATSALPRGTRHPYAELEAEAVAALASEELRWFAILKPERAQS